MKKFIDKLEQAGQLARVGVRVDPELEITEIVDRVTKSGGKAILFEDTGSAFPLLINMFGSESRMCLALGRERLEDIPAEIEAMFSSVMSPKKNLRDKAAMLPVIGRMSKILPKRRRGRGECQQVILKGDEASLNIMPVLKCWPHDGGRFITLPLVHTVDPDSGAPNLGMYRMQIFDDHTAGMHWHKHKTGEKHYQAYKRRGERMPVSICLGGDPAYTYAATAPMPDGMDEYLLAGFLRGRGVKLVKCVTNDLYVPDDCDFVIEGYVDPTEEKVVEGPFGDHTGFYSLEDLYPVMHVTAITHKRNAVYPATIVGVPPQEDFFMGLATEKIFLAPIRIALQPEIRDLWMPAAGVAHNLALVEIEKTYEGQAFKTVSALWGAGQMMFNKIAVIADHSPHELDALAAGIRNARLPEDILLSRGPLDILDHATATPGAGGKIAIDITSRRPRREIVVSAGFTMDGEIDAVDISLAEKWGIVILFADPRADVIPGAFIAHNDIAGINYFVILDTAAQNLTPEEWLWMATGNTDPGRDISVDGGHMIVDARSKISAAKGLPARWPNIVTSTPDTIALVDGRWPEYGLGNPISSPSLRYLNLLHSDKAKA